VAKKFVKCDRRLEMIRLRESVVGEVCEGDNLT
jgi:hypothetical protein